jgi:hypothetical protein
MNSMNSMNNVSSRSNPGDMSTLSTEPQRLDGNAAAGLLAEIFVMEMTSAQSTCAGCGRTNTLGTLLLYGGEMGTILRCPSCDGVQMRIMRDHSQYWMDMRGVARLQMAAVTPA